MEGASLLGGATGLHGRDFVLSLGVHGLLVLMLVLSRSCGDPEDPLFDPDEVMQVQMVALPKAAGRLPDRASRAPRPAEGAREAPPKTSDMVFKTPEATPDKGQERAPPDTRREDLLARMREQAHQDPTAPLGDADRMATDPDSTLSPEEAFGGSGGGLPMDPELARYVADVRKLVLPNWAPLPRIVQENPDIFTVVEIRIEDDGTIRSPRVVRPSGNASFDESCVRALQKTGRLPLPPARFEALARKGVWIHFPASDAR